MKKKSGFLLITGIVFLILCITIFAVLYWFIMRPMPRMNGIIKLPGLKDKVTVLMDKWGIPHIYAENEDDLFMTQGYLHAQNRIWQMELNRAQGNGTLSKILGARSIGSDKFLKSFGLRRIAEKTWDRLDTDSRNILLAYAKGVNAYIDTHKSNLPVEFVIFGVKPESWTPQDTLAFGNQMAFWLSGNHKLEYLRSKIITHIGEELTAQLFPPRVENTPLIIPGEVNNYQNLSVNYKSAATLYDEWIGDPEEGWGSNNWAVNGSRTQGGKPILANDIHLKLGVPSIWYQNGLHGGRFDCVGFSFPCVPGIIVGHNNSIAWGTVNLSPDSQDLYIEELDSLENPTKYKYKGEWIDLTVIHETIEVKGGAVVPYDILLTNHGPIMPSIMGEDTSQTSIALKWSIADANLLFTSVIKLNLATSWEEFKEALRLWEIPGQNIVYADTAGNIGYQATGKVPIRSKKHNGLLPVPGWTGEYEWEGFVPYEEMPCVLNPKQSFIATANNKIVPDSYPYTLTLDWYPGFRAKRITDLLTKPGRLTMEDMQHIQYQFYSIPAETLIPYLTALLPDNEQEKKALEKLKEWDYNVTADSVGAGIYEVWLLYLLKNTISDELGEEVTKKYLSGNYQRHSNLTMPMLLNLFKEKDHILFDITTTTEKENRDDIIKKSFQETLAFYTEKTGKNVNKWTWGRIHTMTFRHFPLGYSGISILEKLFNSKSYPVGGDHFTVNEAGFVRTDPFQMKHGPSMRMIIDFSNFDNSLMLNSTGQTEVLWHSNRKDTIPLWIKGEYYPMYFSREKVQESTKHELIFLPK